jgi:hypothetical protein
MTDREDARKTIGGGRSRASRDGAAHAHAHALGRGRSRLADEAAPVAPSAAGGGPRTATRHIISTSRGLPSGRAVLGGLLVALAALGTYLVATRDSGGAVTLYAVAAKTMPPGATLGAADVKLTALDLPPDQARGTFPVVGALLGATLRGPVQADALFTDAVVERAAVSTLEADAAEGADSGGLGGTGVGPAYRELSVALPAANAVDGMLRPGDRVDVVATDGDASYVLVDRALVVASNGADSGGALGGGDVRVTLALIDAASALAVAHGAAATELTLLRSTRVTEPLPGTYRLPEASSSGSPRAAAAAGG